MALTTHDYPLEKESEKCISCSNFTERSSQLTGLTEVVPPSLYNMHSIAHEWLCFPIGLRMFVHLDGTGQLAGRVARKRWARALERVAISLAAVDSSAEVDDHPVAVAVSRLGGFLAISPREDVVRKILAATDS